MIKDYNTVFRVIILTYEKVALCFMNFDVKFLSLLERNVIIFNNFSNSAYVVSSIKLIVYSATSSRCKAQNKHRYLLYETAFLFCL